MERYLYSELASLVQARLNCLKANMSVNEYFGHHTNRIETLVKDHMPSGSGFDSGTKIDLNCSHADRLCFETSFHHLDESGMYDGWTEHIVTVTPSFNGFHLRVSGRNRNDIKEYIADTFHEALRYDLAPDMAYAATAERTGCELASRWVDNCTHLWDVVIPKREHVWVPVIGHTVKLKTMEAYTSRLIHPFAWLKVFAVVNGIVSFEVLNGSAPTGLQSFADLAEVEVPINWTATYDRDEIVVSGLKSWPEAKLAAVKALAEVTNNA